MFIVYNDIMIYIYIYIYMHMCVFICICIIYADVYRLEASLKTNQS